MFCAMIRSPFLAEMDECQQMSHTNKGSGMLIANNSMWPWPCEPWIKAGKPMGWAYCPTFSWVQRSGSKHWKHLRDAVVVLLSRAHWKLFAHANGDMRPTKACVRMKLVLLHFPLVLYGPLPAQGAVCSRVKRLLNLAVWLFRFSLKPHASLPEKLCIQVTAKNRQEAISFHYAQWFFQTASNSSKMKDLYSGSHTSLCIGIPWRGC